MKKLNIFVDETGDYGFNNKSSLNYGIVFVLHESSHNIKNEILNFKRRLKNIGYDEMVHTADLICNRKNYKNFSLKERRTIFNTLYIFFKKAKINYFTVIIKKDYKNNKLQLKKNIEYEINKVINNYLNYFNKFDKIDLERRFLC